MIENLLWMAAGAVLTIMTQCVIFVIIVGRLGISDHKRKTKAGRHDVR